MTAESEHGFVPLAYVVRDGFVEGVHFGSLVFLNADGSVLAAYGEVDCPMLPRSTNKLLQAAGMRDLGLRLNGVLLALSAASHWGEPQHLAGVRKILALANLDESALQTTSSLPSDPDAHIAAIRSNTAPSAIQHGCSGKHAAMLVTSRLNGWPVETYLSPEHPLQESLKSTAERLVGETSTHTAVDGCGAPAWAFTLRGLADVYRRSVQADTDSSLGAVAAAMRAFPEYVAGEASEVTGLMRGVPGILVKDGAESVYVASLADGRTAAVKISDGGFRAGQAVLVAALLRLGAAAEPAADRPALERWGQVAVLGHGEPVGSVQPVSLEGPRSG